MSIVPFNRRPVLSRQGPNSTSMVYNPRKRRPRRRNNTGGGVQRYDILVRNLRTPLFFGQQIKFMTLPGPSQLVTTSGTSFSVVYPLGNVSTQVIDWTDITATFREYCIIAVHLEVMCMTPPTPGMAFWFFDSAPNAAAPLVVEEASDGVLRTNHSMNVNRVWRRTFVVKDPLFLSYRDSSVNYVLGYWKGMTNNTNFGTTAANTLLYRYTAKYDVLLRGRALQ